MGTILVKPRQEKEAFKAIAPLKTVDTPYKDAVTMVDAPHNLGTPSNGILAILTNLNTTNSNLPTIAVALLLILQALHRDGLFLCLKLCALFQIPIVVCAKIETLWNSKRIDMDWIRTELASIAADRGREDPPEIKRLQQQVKGLHRQVRKLIEAGTRASTCVEIRSVKDGRCLHLSGGGMADGTDVRVESNRSPNLHNLWKIVPAYGFHDDVGIMSMTSGKFLNVVGGGLENGTGVQVHGSSPIDRGATHNLWRVVKVVGSPDRVGIQSVHNGRFLGIGSAVDGMGDGTDVCTWGKPTDLCGEESLWNIVKI